MTREVSKRVPAYYPGREPAGYWKWLQSRKPELLIKRAALRMEGDWTKAGQRVFREMYFPPPEPQNKLIELVRSREALERARVHPSRTARYRPDGSSRLQAFASHRQLVKHVILVFLPTEQK